MMLWLLHDKDRMVRLIWSQYTSVENSDSFRRSRKARGEISMAVIVACRQMSERWLTVVPFPPPRYKTDVASPYGQTRPPHFRYAASLLRFTSHRRYSMPPSR